MKIEFINGPCSGQRTNHAGVPPSTILVPYVVGPPPVLNWKEGDELPTVKLAYAVYRRSDSDSVLYLYQGDRK